VAVIGHLNSGVSMAAAPVYAAKMIPQLAISTKPEYTQMGLPTTFRLVASDALQSKAMGAFAAQLPGGPTATPWWTTPRPTARAWPSRPRPS
jgi:branched-chain amino acid transport system substrate-binding protein